MKYSVLAQKNPQYLTVQWKELDDFYKGGYQLYLNASHYLPSQHNEPADRYHERIKLSSYINYLAMVCDYFTANLFSQELSVHPASDASDPNTIGDEPLPDKFWEIFSHDSDRRGTPFARLMRDIFTTAVLKKKGLVVLDFPDREDVKNEIKSRADEDKLELSRAYIYEIPVEQMLDWEHDDNGAFEWCVTCETKSERRDISKKRETYYQEFKVYRKQEPGTEGGLVDIDVYQTDEYQIGKPIPPDDDVKRIRTINTKFHRIPILELNVPDGLWVGNKIGLLAKEHYQRRSGLNAAENKSLFALPVAHLGSETGAPGDAIPAEKAQNPNRGNDPLQQFINRGFVVIGNKDYIDFAEPAGSCYELVERQLEKLVDEMFRIVHQMSASVTQTRVGLYRSAASKQQDRLTTEIVLSAYGSIVKDFAKQIYDVIAESRDEKVVWVSLGLDKYDLEDRPTILQEAVQMAAITIPSPTFRKEYMSRVAQSLIGDMPPETVKVIRQEIQDSVENDEDIMGLMADRSSIPVPGMAAGAPKPNQAGGSAAAGGSESAGGVKKIPKRGPGGRLTGSVSVK
jgi:hypothetical protein